MSNEGEHHNDMGSVEQALARIPKATARSGQNYKC